MNASRQHSTSLWMARSGHDPIFEADRLAADAKGEVVVVGAGIAGLSTAYELAREGRSVILIDRGQLAGGMTARTSAHLASELDDYYCEHIDMRGLEEAKALYASQAAAIDRIEEIVASERIACDFKRIDGYLYAPLGTDTDILAREMQGCARIGFAGVGWAESSPLPGLAPGRCLRFPRQGRFDPLRYCAGLIAALKRLGVRLHGDTAAMEVREEGGGVVVTTEHGPRINAGAAVFATNSPANDYLAMHSKQAPYRTYVTALRVPSGSVPDVLIWDTLDPYHYVRIQPDNSHDWLIVGGEDHKTGQAADMDERIARLESWAHERWPQSGHGEHCWSGQVMEPVDIAPFIGVNPGNERVFVVTGDSGEGLTNGVAASLILRDLVAGRRNPWAEATDPSRITLGAALEFISENTTVVESFAARTFGGERRDPQTLAPGEAAVLSMEGENVAAWRDPAGVLHLRSAVCTHAGCVVNWNPFERCWDCPCHGSQFAPDGTVLNGPALTPLPEIRDGKS